MRALRLDVIEICPWALRRGLILRRLDWLGAALAGNIAEPDAGVLHPSEPETGRLTLMEARHGRA